MVLPLGCCGLFGTASLAEATPPGQSEPLQVIPSPAPNPAPPQADQAPGTPAVTADSQPRTPESLPQLLQELADPATKDWPRVQADVQREWSRSGSAAMDLLLERGRQALEAGEPEVALEHLSALVDHAPDFAEGWNARATANYMTGNIGPALDDLSHVLALNPQQFSALAGLGMILQQLDRPGLAERALRASLKLNPHQAKVRAALDQLDQDAEGTPL